MGSFLGAGDNARHGIWGLETERVFGGLALSFKGQTRVGAERHPATGPWRIALVGMEH